MLRQSGLFDRLEEMGIQDGDIVSLYNLEFEYQRVKQSGRSGYGPAALLIWRELPVDKEGGYPVK